MATFHRPVAAGIPLRFSSPRSQVGGREFYRQLQLVRVTYPKSNMRMDNKKTTSYVVSSQLKHIESNWISFPQLEVNIKKMETTTQTTIISRMYLLLKMMLFYWHVKVYWRDNPRI